MTAPKWTFMYDDDDMNEYWLHIATGKVVAVHRGNLPPLHTVRADQIADAELAGPPTEEPADE